MSINFQAIRLDNPLLDVISRYVELVRRGSEYVGLCPFHDDSKPSLTVYNASDGLMRYRCFSCGAGSEGGDVIDFIAAIERVDTTEACKVLSANKLPTLGTFKPPKPSPDKSHAWRSILPVPEDAPVYDPAKTFNPKAGRMRHYRPTRVDAYLDEQSRLLCYVVRLDFDVGEKMCPTITYCEGPEGQRLWAAKRMPGPFPLQGLDDLANHPKTCVLLVSGEKCRQMAAEHTQNFVVVTWMGGDQAVGSCDIRPLLGRNIVFWADADPSSKRSMITMHNLIEKAGTG
jgi:hypothetical protein